MGMVDNSSIDCGSFIDSLDSDSHRTEWNADEMKRRNSIVFVVHS